jgi:Flp pilus assembly protein TadD
VAALLGTCAAFAQTAVVQQTEEVVRSGTAMEAFERLAEQEVRRAGELEFDLALGIAANEAGQFTRAIIALERVLAVQPSHERARAELGRALYGVGDHKAARALLAESQLKGFTAVAGDTIDQLLHAIDRVEADAGPPPRATWN